MLSKEEILKKIEENRERIKNSRKHKTKIKAIHTGGNCLCKGVMKHNFIRHIHKYKNRDIR